MRAPVVCILIACCCFSCGVSKRQTDVEREYDSSFLRLDSSFSNTSKSSVEDLIHRGKLKAHINIRTFSTPDSLGAQYLLSETGVDLVASGVTKKRRAEEEEQASGGGSLNAGHESGSGAVKETEDIDRRPFPIPGWLWWIAGAIGAGYIVFKTKDWFKRLG